MSVTYAERHKSALYAFCHNAECRCAGCRGTTRRTRKVITERFFGSHSYKTFYVVIVAQTKFV